MSTQLDKRTTTELEELFSQEVPCGGNLTPSSRPCPHQAAAKLALVRWCSCEYSDADKFFKCFSCWADWVTAFPGPPPCSFCGAVSPVSRVKVYREI